MKSVFLLFPLALVQFPNMISANYDTCPSQSNPCQSPSSLSDLICYTYKPAKGLNFAFFGFGNGISALCSIDFDCDAGTKSRLDVLKVFGFIAELTRDRKANASGEESSQLWYIDISHGQGCARVFPVKNSRYQENGRGFNAALSPAAVPADLAYQIFTQTKRAYRGQCNVFQASETVSCGACSTGSTCDCRLPITSVSLSQVKSAYVFSSHSNVSAGEKYIEDYGICGVKCTQSPTPERTSNPPIYYEICSSYGYSNTDMDCKDYENTVQLYQILQSYGYEQQFEHLDPYEACKISTFWARGYNKQGKGVNSCSHRDCNSDGYATSFCSIVLIPQLSDIVYEGTRAENPVGVVYVQLEGFCENSIKESILKYFLNTC